MKTPLPLPEIPEGTPWQTLDYAFRTALKVSKEELIKEEARLKRARRRKNRRKKPT